MGEFNLSFEDLLQAIVQSSGGGTKRSVEEAPDIDELVKKLVTEHEEFEDLREHLDRLRCFRVSGGQTPKWIARVIRGQDAFVKLAGMDVALEVYASEFDALDEQSKEAIIYHELLHLSVAGTGELKIHRDHDLEEFAAVIAKFGPILPTHRLFVLSLKPHRKLVEKIWEEGDGDVEG